MWVYKNKRLILVVIGRVTDSIQTWYTPFGYTTGDMARQAKTQTSIRLSRDAMVLRKLLSHKLGISQADVIEMSIRRLAELEHVKVPSKRKPRPTGPR